MIGDPALITVWELNRILEHDATFAAEALEILGRDRTDTLSTYTTASSTSALLAKWLRNEELQCFNERGELVRDFDAVLYPDKHGDTSLAEEVVERGWLVPRISFVLLVRDYGMTVPSPFVRQTPDEPGSSLLPNELGYTIDGAARELGERGHVNEEAMKAQLRNGVFANEILVVDQGTGMTQPAGPRELRDFHSRIRTSDLNAWLEKKGVEYRLGTPVPEERGNSQLPSRTGVSRTRIMDGFMVKRLDAENKEYWDDKLSRPPKWLAGARVSVGRPGKSSVWNPALVAHALRGKNQMSLKSLDAAMKNFPEWEPEWREQTELDR